MNGPNVQVERNGAAEPRAVLLRLTPAEAETLQVGWLMAQTMLVGFMNRLKGEDDGEAKHLIKQGMALLIADNATVDSVHALLKEVHMQMCHNEHGADDGHTQNWRCN